MINQKIRDFGGRMTKIKIGILDILIEKDCLVSRKEIAKLLLDREIDMDRSSLYRELQFLLKNKIITETHINGEDYFEIENKGCHHHHLICLNCKNIEKIKMNNHLEEEEEKIKIAKDFKIIRHSLDFYGYCKKCKNLPSIKTI